MTKQAMQQALEALEANLCKWEEKEKAVHILRAALDEPQTTHWEGCEAVHSECTKPEQKPQHPLDMPLDVFMADLTTRSSNCIKCEMSVFNHRNDEFIKPPFTVRHLLMWSRSEMRRWPNFGRKSLNEVEEWLRNIGLQLWEFHDERSLRLLRQHPTYFTAPPQRKPLSEEEISAIDWKSGETLHEFARAIEKAHGIGGSDE